MPSDESPGAGASALGQSADNCERTDITVALINHLSKEIESQTSAMVSWRTRMNFTAYFGPWIVVGAYFAVGNKVAHWPSGRVEWIASVVASVVFIAAYMLIGHCAATVEKHVWERCNKWRLAIADL